MRWVWAAFQPHSRRSRAMISTSSINVDGSINADGSPDGLSASPGCTTTAQPQRCEAGSWMVQSWVGWLFAPFLANDETGTDIWSPVALFAVA